MAATGLVRPEERFQFYVSPFEALQLDEEERDAKIIQRAKKQLLIEIDLNDGKVSWLDDFALDKSRVHTLDDEIYDPKKARGHRFIFRNKPLLRFLTQGDIGLFLNPDGLFPQPSHKLLDQEPELRALLSKPFARQYNFVLTRAIERRLLPLVQVLFDGPRLVEPKDEDVCFEGAYRRIGELVELMRTKENEGHARKLSLGEIEDFLRQHSFPELFNLLPPTFASQQMAVIAALRSVAIDCIIKHNDADLSIQVLTHRLKG